MAAAPSAGCTASAPGGGPAGTSAGVNRSVPFTAAGETGLYLLASPAGDGPGHPLPLVVDLHGYLETAQEQDTITGLSAYGDSHGFVTVTPQVDETVPHWDFAPGSPDRAFIGALMTHVEATQCIDLHRVYLAGYSNGAFMTSWLVCQYADRVAAVATVAGIQAPPGCHPSRPVPVIAFHGTADPFVPYQGGVGPEAVKMEAPDGKGTIGSELGTAALAGISPSTLPIPTEEARWAVRNGCTGPPNHRVVATGVVLVAYHCPADATVDLYREDGDGHIWAGSPLMPGLRSVVGPTTFAIDDDRLIWAFFRAHPLGRS